VLETEETRSTVSQDFELINHTMICIYKYLLSLKEHSIVINY